jgi:hypothetical protein
MSMADRRRELVGIPGKGNFNLSRKITQSYYVYRMKNGNTRVRSQDHKDWINPTPAYHTVLQFTGEPEPTIINIDEEDVLLIPNSIIKLADRTGTVLPVQPIATVMDADSAASTDSMMIALTAAPADTKALNWKLIISMMSWVIEFLQTERKMENEQLKDMHEVCLDIVSYAYSDMSFSMTFGDDLVAWQTAFGMLFQGASAKNTGYSRKSNSIIEKHEFKRQYLFPSAFIQHNRIDW